MMEGQSRAGLGDRRWDPDIRRDQPGKAASIAGHSPKGLPCHRPELGERPVPQLPSESGMV